VYVAPLIGHDAARRTEITIVPRRLHYMNEIDQSLEDQTMCMFSEIKYQNSKIDYD
jgi:hypothetical protein